jgi:hypothetical protein
VKEVKRKVLKQKRKEPMNFDCYRILAHPSNRRDYTESVPAGEEEHRRAATYSRVIMDGRTNGGGKTTRRKEKIHNPNQKKKKRERKKKKKKQIPRLLTDEIDSHLEAATFFFLMREIVRERLHVRR